MDARTTVAALLAALLASSAGCASFPGCQPNTPCQSRQGTGADVLGAVAATVARSVPSTAPTHPHPVRGSTSPESIGDGAAVRCTTASGFSDDIVTHGDGNVVATCELMNGEPCTCESEPE